MARKKDSKVVEVINEPVVKEVVDDGIACCCRPDGKGGTIVCKKHKAEGREY